MLIFSPSDPTSSAGSGNTPRTCPRACGTCFLFVMYRGGLRLSQYKSWRNSRKPVFGQLELEAGARQEAVRHSQREVIQSTSSRFHPEPLLHSTSFNVSGYKLYHSVLHKLVEKEHIYNFKLTSSPLKTQLCLLLEDNTVATTWLNITTATSLLISRNI